MIGGGMSHRGMYRRKGGEPWTPAEINTRLWLDGSDSDTVIISGSSSGDVESWRDKSGNNNNVSQSNTSFQPLYSASRGSLIFNGNKSLSGGRFLDFLHNFLGTTYIMFKPETVGAGGVYGVLSTCLRTGSDRGITMEFNTISLSNGGQCFIFNGNDSNIAANEKRSNILIPEQRNLWAVRWDVLNTTLTDRVLQTVDGTSYAGSNVEDGPRNLSASRRTVTIGALINSSFFVGEIQEIIVTIGTQSVSDFQKVEGYLAHKWGTTTDLDPTHPYKNSPPTL